MFSPNVIRGLSNNSKYHFSFSEIAAALHDFTIPPPPPVPGKVGATSFPRAWKPAIILKYITVAPRRCRKRERESMAASKHVVDLCFQDMSNIDGKFLAPFLFIPKIPYVDFYRNGR
jgi:hypothetical protein